MIDMKLVTETGDSRSYPIKGKTKNKKVYSIPLDQLKYNKKNGRIASYIVEYSVTNGELPEDYNNILEKYIIQSNLSSFRKTKDNIKIFGQLEPAVVLADGTIVDGNRRFTALRQLSREGAGSEFAYLKAIILDQSQFTEKEIKIFELNLQHGREERVDYNPIEYLIDIYRDLLADDHEFTPEEYARETNETVQSVRKDMRIAQLLVGYLKYINQPLQFHLARQSNLDGPLREIDNILRSGKVDKDSHLEIKEYLFTNIATLDGDLTRQIRALRPIVENQEKFDNAYEGLEDEMDEIYNAFREKPDAVDSGNINLETDTSIITVPSDIKEKVKSKTEDVIETERIRTAQYKPVDIVKRALKNLEEIDLKSVSLMNEADKQEFQVYMEAVETIVQKIKENKHADRS